MLGERTADQWQQDAFGPVDAWLSALGLRLFVTAASSVKIRSMDMPIIDRRVATRLVLKYNIRAGGDHHLGPQVLLAVELDALFNRDEADLAMDQRFHDLDHLPAVGDGFHGSVQ